MNVGIVTIIDNDNYGNRLQNYALQTYINNEFDIQTTTLINDGFSNDKKFYFFRLVKNKIVGKKYKVINNIDRKNNFDKFNQYIKFSLEKVNCFSNFSCFDCVIVGSDQVWNPNFRRLRDLDLLNNKTIRKRISYAASFGVNDISLNNRKKMYTSLQKFDAISVREAVGKKIINDMNIKNVEVLIDPTMLLTADEWDKVSKKPTMLKDDKYILNYFLGNLSDERRNEINRVAKENNCEVINILDKESPFYECGPSEFLYLEKNAQLICTDSFHSSVFAILFNRPFIVFDREQNDIVSMNSRIETLIDMFKLENRKYNNQMITRKNLEHDYTDAYKILYAERTKSYNFLKKALYKKEKKYGR